MEKILIEFIDTLDSSFKTKLAEIGNVAGMSQLTISQIQYIDAIHRLQQPTITEIANKLGLAKASVSTGINRLIEKGYVTKTQSDRDRRVFHLDLTALGKQSIDAKDLAVREYSNFIASVLTNEEAQQLEIILTKLVGLFGQK